jgi:hypothetical protein
MLRKAILALAAAGSLAALAPTSASAAWGWHGHGYWPNRPYFGRVFVPPVRVYPAPAYVYTAAPCLRERWVATPFGPRLRWVNVCVY